MRVFETMGTIGVSTKLTSTNTAQALPSTLLVDPTSGRDIAAATLVFETNDIRIAFNVDPTQAGLGVNMEDGDSYRIVGTENLKSFKFISAVNNVHGSVQVVPEY